MCRYRCRYRYWRIYWFLCLLIKPLAGELGSGRPCSFVCVFLLFSLTYNFARRERLFTTQSNSNVLGLCSVAYSSHIRVVNSESAAAQKDPKHRHFKQINHSYNFSRNIQDAASLAPCVCRQQCKAL